MEYRINKNNGDKISLIGMGSGAVCMNGKTEGAELLRTAYENGINYFDMATSVAEVFGVFGEALSDVRKQIKYQIHFGAVYDTGEYGWSLNTDQIKKSVDWQLESILPYTIHSRKNNGYGSYKHAYVQHQSGI